MGASRHKKTLISIIDHKEGAAHSAPSSIYSPFVGHFDDKAFRF